ncbi:hypothetical protein [Paracoccus sediminilitoris]|uniref:hypothetical protein n=1 Tax=Paracoccus sediminilitoris TaxID=2202419 RepID=UPI002729F0C5|nr:hypothetical protein [Paracoccus sediminilitoris]
MLSPVAGSRLFIADAPQADPRGGAPSGLSWVEIGQAEAFGVLGGSYELQDTSYMGCNEPGYMAAKGQRRPTTMQIIMGLDMEDPGQLILARAYAAPEAAYPFRLLFADGVNERRWMALVMRFEEVFDAANSVMRMQADLHPANMIIEGRSDA